MPTSGSTTSYALGTFSIAGSPAFPGLVIDSRVVALEALACLCRELHLDLRRVDSLGSLLEDWSVNERALNQVVAHLAGAEFHRLSVPVTCLKTHAPLERPRQIFCSGANYRKHVIDLIVDQAREPAVSGMNRNQRLEYATRLMDERAASGTPYIFARTGSSITGPFDPIPIPSNVEQPDWELELAVIIGRTAFRVSRENAYDYVAGYTICNDITNRELVHRQDLKAIGTDWVMGKCLPGYLPMGPYFVPAAFVGAPQDLQITLKLNGDIKQNESTSGMIFDIARLIEYLTSHIRLYPGDLLLTGSPSGNGSHYNRFLRPGDLLEGSITHLGSHINTCISGP